MKNFTYYMPVKIFFGKGELEKLGTEKLPGKKALIVISAGGSMKKRGYLERVEKLLSKNGCETVLFDKVKPNPAYRNVMEGAALARKEGCDFILGLGGGSSIDSAKSISVMATNEGDYWDYIAGGSGKQMSVENDPLPVIAVTTTAGTGTEADPWTVITKEDTNEKIGFGYEKTFPVISIVDPDLMMTVPPKLTAYQGFDALFHAVEGYIANIATPFSDIYALKSIELIGRSLAKAVKNGSDKDARAEVALANTMSGFVESTSSCTSEHSLEHALSAFHYDLPHGAGLIMLSVAYHSYFINKIPERYIDMAKALGKKNADKPSDFIDALKNLQAACGVDELKMSDYGIVKDDSMKYAENAFETMGGLFTFDPAEMTKADAAAIIENSFR